MKRARVFHLTGRSLTVQRWADGRLVEAFAFDPTPEGSAAFSRYLHSESGEPSLLLADLVEEEFVTEAVPHTVGRERRQLYARRAERLFRGSSLRATLKLGREPTGRRDDRVLISAFTRPGAFIPWLDQMVEAQVPLLAVSSIPHLSAALPSALGLKEADLMLVTPSEAGLRQTFFHQGEMRASRLSPPTADAGAVVEECLRTRRYLLNGLLLPAEVALHIYLVAHEPLLTALERVPLPEALHLHLCAVEDVAGQLDLAYCPAVGTPSLFGGLFLRAPANRYAQGALLRGRQLRRARWAMELGGVVIALLLCCLSVVASLGALEHRRAMVGLESELGRTSKEADRDPPDPLPDGMTPERLRTVVETAERLAALPMGPDRALSRLGRALLAHPDIALRRIDWEADPGSHAPGGATTGESPSHAVTIEGEVRGAEGGLRGALRKLERLSNLLRRMPEVVSVDPTSAALLPDATVKGNLGRDDPELPFLFSMRVVLRP